MSATRAIGTRLDSESMMHTVGLTYMLSARRTRGPWLIAGWRGYGVAVGGVLAATSVALLGLPTSPVGPFASSAAAAERPPVGVLSVTAAQLNADLMIGARLRTVPPNLDPPLATARGAGPIIGRNGCHLSRSGLRSKPCIYGDASARTSVALFGDSHAAAWFPALDLISRWEHWRLIDLTKDGCPPAEVKIAAWFRHGANYWECTRWRTTAEAQIVALHPSLVIMTEARYLEEPEARPLPGVPTDHGGAWQDGLTAVFKFLRRSARHVIFVSDVPTLREWAPECVSTHMSNVRACTTPRSAAVLLPNVKKDEIQLAKREGVSWIDPVPWFCAPLICPVIVGNILLYRDNAHMVPAWAQFIAPILSNAIVPAGNARQRLR